MTESLLFLDAHRARSAELYASAERSRLAAVARSARRAVPAPAAPPSLACSRLAVAR